jgi:LytS/YehU family sensor histidine kinase
LSYMLYECDAQTVPLSREVEMMREYITTEKMKLGESFELELNINDDLNNLSISPFLLLPFIENGFQLSSRHCDSAWMNMDLSVNGNIFQMTLTHGLYPDDNQIDTPPDIILNVQKRLKLLFQNRYELKMYTQEEMMIVQLKLQLDECKVTDQNQQYFSSISTFDL